MLVLYAKELKEGFAPYADDVVQLMVPLLKFYFHELVRSAAAESLPYLLECSKFKGDAAVRQMWAYVCSDLLKAIRSEPDADIQIIFLENFAKCVETLGNGCLTVDFYNLLAEVLHEILTAHKERQMERQSMEIYGIFYSYLMQSMERFHVTSSPPCWCPMNKRFLISGHC
jgi:hypothetical protein